MPNYGFQQAQIEVVFGPIFISIVNQVLTEASHSRPPLQRDFPIVNKTSSPFQDYVHDYRDTNNRGYSIQWKDSSGRDSTEKIA